MFFFNSILVHLRENINKKYFHPGNLIKNKWIFLLSLSIYLVVVGFYAYSKLDSTEDAYSIQGLCFWGAFLGTIFTVFQTEKLKIQPGNFTLNIHPAWLLVVIAACLRWACFSIFPPIYQTGFEESQTGEIAYSMMFSHVPTLEFRFTNMMAFWGFSTFGIDLFSLRLPFKISGIISLFLITFSLRKLDLSWISTLLIVFISATLRLLVIASGSADEIFSSIIFASAFLYCLISLEKSENFKGFWAGISGILCGILMFEYISYRIYILMGLSWLIWVLFLKRKNQPIKTKEKDLFPLFIFIITLCLMALPTIVQIIHNPIDSIFFEAFLRHGVERPSILTSQAMENVKYYFLSLTGWPSGANIFTTPPGETFIFPVIGWLFGISFFYCLLFSKNGLSRLMAFMVIVELFSASLTANNHLETRMISIIPLFLLMSGIFIEALYINFSKIVISRLGKKKIILTIESKPNFEIDSQPILEAVNHVPNSSSEVENIIDYSWNINKISVLIFNSIILISVLFLMWKISIVNFESLIRMSQNPFVKGEYANSDYSVCSYIGSKIQKPGQRVLIYSVDNQVQCPDQKSLGWYFREKQPEILHFQGDFITPELVQPGDLVVLGARGRALTEEEISLIVDLGKKIDSLSSMQQERNIAGRVVAVSICKQCQNSQSGE